MIILVIYCFITNYKKQETFIFSQVLRVKNPRAAWLLGSSLALCRAAVRVLAGTAGSWRLDQGWRLCSQDGHPLGSWQEASVHHVDLFRHKFAWVSSWYVRWLHPQGGTQGQVRRKPQWCLLWLIIKTDHKVFYDWSHGRSFANKLPKLTEKKMSIDLEQLKK